MSILDQRDERFLAILLSRHAAQRVPASIDLWPTFQARMATHQRAKRRAVGYRPALRIVSAFTILLIVLLPIAVPGVQAAFRGRLERFGLILIRPTPIPVPSPAQPAVVMPIATPSQPLQRMSMADAQRQVPFPIRVPTWLPNGLMPRGAIVAPGPSADSAVAPLVVDTAYGPASGSGGGLHLQQAPVGVPASYAFPADRAQDTQVNGQSALYIKGAWQAAGQWNDAEDSATLSWEADGFTYLLQYSGLGLTRADLIRIAESLR
jgi:hypothetical protein